MLPELTRNLSAAPWLRQHCTGWVQTRTVLKSTWRVQPLLLTQLLYQDRRAMSWPSFSVIHGGEILSADQQLCEQQPLEWSCLQSYKAYSTEIFKNLVLKVLMALRKDIRANGSSIIKVWHEEMCRHTSQRAVNSLPMYSCLVRCVLKQAHSGWLN